MGFGALLCVLAFGVGFGVLGLRGTLDCQGLGFGVRASECLFCCI